MWLEGSSLGLPSNFGMSKGRLDGIAGQVGSWSMGSLISLLRSGRFRLTMKGMLDLAIAIDWSSGDVAEGGGGDGSGGDPEVLWFLDLSNVERRGSPSTVVGEGDVTGSCLRLLYSRGETPPIKGGRFCNLNDWQRVGGVAMFAKRVVGIQCPSRMNAVNFNQLIYVKDDEKWKLSACVQQKYIWPNFQNKFYFHNNGNRKCNSKVKASYEQFVLSTRL